MRSTDVTSRSTVPSFETTNVCEALPPPATSLPKSCEPGATAMSGSSGAAPGRTSTATSDQSTLLLNVPSTGSVVGLATAWSMTAIPAAVPPLPEIVSRRSVYPAPGVCVRRRSPTELTTTPPGVVVVIGRL